MLVGLVYHAGVVSRFRDALLVQHLFRFIDPIDLLLAPLALDFAPARELLVGAYL